MRINKRACLLVASQYILSLLFSFAKCDDNASHHFCQVQFFGQEFSKLDAGKNSSQEFEVRTWFKTRSLYGLLVALVRNDSDWDGFDLANGSIRSISSSRTPLITTSSARTLVSMVTVNQWYQMHIKINQNIIKLSITGELVNFTDTVHNTREIKVIYLGGIPLKLHKMAMPSVLNFTGCMSKMAVTRFGIWDFKKYWNRKISLLCQTSSCKERTASLSGGDSTVTLLRTLNEKSKNLYMSFQFRTKQKDAFLAEWNHKSFDVQFIINDGLLRVRLCSKPNNTKTLTSDVGEIPQGEWNNIEMAFSTLKSKLLLTLNGKGHEIGVPRHFSPLLTRSRFVLGGTGKGFVGCIRNVICQNSIINFSIKPRWVKLNHVVVGDCNPTNRATTNLLGNTTDNISSTFVNISDVFGNTTDLFGNGSIVHQGDTNPTVSDISLFYQVTATIVIVLFVLIVFYVAFVLIKNKFQKHRKKDDEQEERMSSRQCRRSDIVSLPDVSMHEEQENRSNKERPVIEQEKRYSQQVKYPKNEGRNDVRLLSPTFENVNRNSFMFLTPQLQTRAQQFSFTDIPCVILTLQDEQAAFQSKNDSEQTKSCHNSNHEDITHEEAKSPRISQNTSKKVTDTLNPSFILNPKVSSTYNWAYFRPDSETECSESEKMRPTKLDASYRPFSLRILEGNESDEEDNDYSTGLYNKDFQTFRSKSTDNIARGDFLKVCFDPYLSSSQGEKLVCFGAQSSSNPSVMSSKLDHDVCKTLQQKYRQQKNDKQQPRCNRYRKLQVDSSPCTKLTSEKYDRKEKEKQEVKQNSNHKMSIHSKEIPQIYVQEQFTNGYQHEDVENRQYPLHQDKVISSKQCQENQQGQQNSQEESYSLKQPQPEKKQQQQELPQQREKQQGYQKQPKLQQLQKKQQQLQQEEAKLERKQQPQQNRHQKQQGCQKQQCLHQQSQQEQQHCLSKQELQPQSLQHQQLHKQLNHLQMELKQQHQLKHNEQQFQPSSSMSFVPCQLEGERKAGPLKHNSSTSLNDSDQPGDKEEIFQDLTKFNLVKKEEFQRNNPVDATQNAYTSITNGCINPWVLKQAPTNKKQPTTRLTRLNKPLRQEQLKAKSSSQILKLNDDDAEPYKVWKRRSWASGNVQCDSPREQSRDIELVLKGTVPVKKPPSNATILLTVPKTKVRPRSETMC